MLAPIVSGPCRNDAPMESGLDAAHSLGARNHQSRSQRESRMNTQSIILTSKHRNGEHQLISAELGRGYWSIVVQLVTTPAQCN